MEGAGKPALLSGAWMPVAIMSQFFRLNLVCFGPVILGLAASHAWATGAAFDYAARLYQQAEWQQAADGFARCLQNSNTEPSKLTSTHFYLGECLVQLGHFAEARQQYEMVLQAGAGDQFAPQATFRIGEIAWLAADPSQAKSRLSQFVQKYPHNALTAYALAYLGEIALAQNDLQQAIVFYRRVVENYSHSPNANKVRVELAKTLLTVGRVDEVSVAIGRLASADDPKWASESLLIQGRAAYHGKHFETAQEDFRRLYERYPDSPLAPRARLAAGWSLWKLGKIADIEEMISPLESNPRWQEDYHYLLGLAANEVQRGSSAMKEPAKDDLASSLENALSEIGQSSGAVASTDQQPAPRLAQDDDPTREPAQFDHEDFLVDQPTPLLAQDDYPTSLEIEGVRQVNASRQAQLLDEAVGLVRDGRHDAALAAYRELLLTHSPGEVHAEALWRSARLHDRLAQRADALQLYRQLLAEYPETTHAAEARLALAWHLDRSGERVSARVEFQELHSKFPQSSQASEAAYWLAVAAADETDSSRSSHYADWLLVRLSDADKRTTPRHRELWGRTLCLKCQLVAATERWQVIRELVAQHGGEFEEGSIKKRLDLWSAEAEFRSGRYGPSEDDVRATPTAHGGCRRNLGSDGSIAPRTTCSQTAAVDRSSKNHRPPGG